MLSIEKIKQLLDDFQIADKDAEEIRDGFRILAEIIFEKWQKEYSQKNDGSYHGDKNNVL